MSIGAARAPIEEALGRHGWAALLFSGGKDSLACLHLAEPWWDRIVVMWVNTGDAFPETLEQMAAIRRLVPYFHEVRTDQPAQVAANGWPVDAFPLAHAAGAFARPAMQGRVTCHATNVGLPSLRALLALGVTLVIRGDRRDEAEANGFPVAEPGLVVEGFEQVLPVYDWTSEEVFSFLRDQGVAIPDSYRLSAKSLPACMSCTAFLGGGAGKWRWLREKHPEIADEVHRRLSAIREALAREVDIADEALGNLRGNGEGSGESPVPKM